MDKTILYFDCFSGISGDMTIGALLDLGVDIEYFKNELKKLKLHEYKREISKKIKKGITGTDFNVILHEDGHAHAHENKNDSEQEQKHHHEHSHNHHNCEHEHHHHHSHHHLNEEHHHGRNIGDINKLIDERY